MLAAALIALFGGTGCGAFVTDSGIFPLPAIHLVYPLPSQLGLTFETVRIGSPAGSIFAWFIPAENAKGTVFISHGAVNNRSSHLAHYELLHNMGYHVFIYDYQGFGENLSVITINNILSDARLAFAKLLERTEPGTEKIVMFGLSMGTLPTMAIAADDPERVVGVMLEGSFITESLPPLSFIGLGITPSPLAYTRIPADLNPLSHIDRIGVPKLFLQSRDDTITPFDSARELFDLATTPKYFVPLSGLHTYSVIFDPSYGPRIEEFLNAVTGN